MHGEVLKHEDGCADGNCRSEEMQPEHVLFCHPFCDAGIVARARCMFIISYNYDTIGSLCTKTFVEQCARQRLLLRSGRDTSTERLSFVVVLPYKNFCWLQSANVR